MEWLNKQVYCWKVDNKETKDDDDPRSIEIKETAGEHVMQDKLSSITVSEFKDPLKIKKHNIGTK